MFVEKEYTNCNLKESSKICTYALAKIVMIGIYKV